MYVPSITEACAAARNIAAHSVATACRLLLKAGLTLQLAARYVLAYLRSTRTTQGATA